MSKHLFLFGGSPPFTIKMAKQFVKLASKVDAPVSILLVERKGWEEYMPKYTRLLEELGLNKFTFLPLPSTPIEQVIYSIKNSSGLIIGGGNTNLYADYIVDTEISKSIMESYESGIPVAGFSAGALICPTWCIISPKDNVNCEFQQRKGLGLIPNVLIAVHFSQWNDEDHLRYAISKFKNHLNFGIDEETGIYFLNGIVEASEGYGVYTIENENLIRVR